MVDCIVYSVALTAYSRLDVWCASCVDEKKLWCLPFISFHLEYSTFDKTKCEKSAKIQIRDRKKLNYKNRNTMYSKMFCTPWHSYSVYFWRRNRTRKKTCNNTDGGDNMWAWVYTHTHTYTYCVCNGLGFWINEIFSTAVDATNCFSE